MANFYVGEVLFETGGTINTPGDINVTAICDCSGSTGNVGQLLSSTGTALLWTDAGAPAIPCSILTAKGSIVVGSAPGVPTALPVGSNGYILAANSSCSAGVEWVANSTGDVTSVSGTSPITVDNSNPQTPIIGICAASTSGSGAVQLNDTVASTSTTQAATANAVKTAYEAAIASVQTVTGTSPVQVDASDPQNPDVSVDVATTTTTGVVSVGSNLSVTAGGEINVSAATTSTLGVVSVGTNIDVTAGGAISVASATTSQPGIVQLNNTTGSTSTTEALTAAQGKNLQDQITALSISSNITLGGTYNANTGLVDSVTAQGTTAGLVAGNALPTPASGNNEIFVIVDVQGSNGPNSPTVAHVGDWYLSDGTTWQFLNVGFAPGQATTTSQGVVELATNAEVQAGTDSNNAVVSSSLQSKLSDSTSTNCSTLIASSAAVKSAYDLAAAAIPCAAVTGKGALVTGTASSTPTALAVGANGQILYACSTATSGLCWAAPPAPPSAATPVAAGIILGCTLVNNTALGCNALLAAPTGCFNTAVGASALTLVGAGNFNVGVGGFAVACNVTGCHNIGLGVNAARNALGSNNTVIGHNALFNATGGCNTVLGFQAGCNLTTGGFNVIIGPETQVASATGSCQLAIGFSPTNNWLTGTSTKAIRPGAGIIDCAGSCGSNGQVLMSNGSNAICWGTVSGGGGSGTVTCVVAGAGLCGGPVTSSGTICLDTTCVIQPSALTAKGSLITATAASTPTALGVGSNGQVLTACSGCSTGLVWAEPPTVYTKTTSSTISFTAGVPVNILNFGTDNSVVDMTLMTVPQNTIAVVWKAVKVGDPTNTNSGWNPFYSFPVPSIYNPGTLVMLSPVYPDPLAGTMILEYTPAVSFTGAFVLVYSAIYGAAPTWMI